MRLLTNLCSTGQACAGSTTATKIMGEIFSCESALSRKCLSCCADSRVLHPLAGFSIYLQASKSLHFAAWVRCISAESLLPEQRQLSRNIVQELNFLTRHRDLARQKYKIAGVESAFARMESMRTLDTLILSFQDKAVKSRSLSPAGGAGPDEGAAADIGSDALFGRGSTSDKRSQMDRNGDSVSPGTREGGLQGMAGVANLIDSMLAQRRAGSDIDFDSLMALSQSLDMRRSN